MKEPAAAFGREYHCFSSVFHQCFSINFRELLNFFRYEKAYELTTTTDKSFAEIAMLSGFQNLSVYNSTFKKHIRMTPSEYRKHISR